MTPAANDSVSTFPWLPAGPAILFAPANRPDRFEKALSHADMVILDLEDGAGETDFDQARENIAQSNLPADRVIVRITGPESPTFADDVEFAKSCSYDIIMVPKVRSEIPAELEGVKVIAMIETPQAVINIQQIAEHPSVVGLFWGAEDLAAELGGTSSRKSVLENPRRTYRDPQRITRAMVQIHAAAAGIASIDAIYADFRDDHGQYHEALDAAGCGFTATACIHPAMVDPIRKAYQPSKEALNHAKEIARAALKSEGAFALHGKMIDAPIVKQAHIALSRAGVSVADLAAD